MLGQVIEKMEEEKPGKESGGFLISLEFIELELYSCERRTLVGKTETFMSGPRNIYDRFMRREKNHAV